MSNFFFVLMLIAMLAVVASLTIGLVVMAKGGEANKKFGNKLMQARITLQGIAILLFILAVISR